MYQGFDKNFMDKMYSLGDISFLDYVKNNIKDIEFLKIYIHQFYHLNKPSTFKYLVDEIGIDFIDDIGHYMSEAAYYGCYGIVEKILDYNEIYNYGKYGNSINTAVCTSQARCHNDIANLIIQRVTTKNRLNKIDKILNRDV